MPERPVDEAREQRIQDEIVVDAYGPEEQATGWMSPLKSGCGSPSGPGASPSELSRRSALTTMSR